MTSADGADVVARFIAALRNRPRDRPVVIVLDTFEEVFRPAVNPAGILQLLARTAREIPALRVVFAGRYDLHERMAARGETADLADLADHQMLPLTPAEERRYLVEVRGIQDESTVEQISWLPRDCR